MSINKRLIKYKNSGFDIWHTPGHKGVVNPQDITEIADGNFFPSDSILKAEKFAGKIYGAKYCRFLVNGSSIGIKTAILSVNGDILAQSCSHPAVKHGAELAKVNLFTFGTMGDDGIYKIPTINEIEDAIKLHPSIKALVITSPDYFGRVIDNSVVELCKRYNILLIADSAHGAHFSFCPDLDNKSFSSTADFCNMSAHKTLNAYTQSAYLCINNKEYIEKAEHNLELLGTTSPSYLFFDKLENCLYDALKNKDNDEYIRLQRQYIRFSKMFKVLKNQDYTRLCIDCTDFNMTSKQLYDYLFKNGIIAEMNQGNYVVFITTPNDDNQKFLRLYNVLCNLKNH